MQWKFCCSFTARRNTSAHDGCKSLLASGSIHNVPSTDDACPHDECYKRYTKYYFSRPATRRQRTQMIYFLGRWWLAWPRTRRPAPALPWALVVAVAQPDNILAQQFLLPYRLHICLANPQTNLTRKIETLLPCSNTTWGESGQKRVLKRWKSTSTNIMELLHKNQSYTRVVFSRHEYQKIIHFSDFHT